MKRAVLISLYVLLMGSGVAWGHADGDQLMQESQATDQQGKPAVVDGDSGYLFKFSLDGYQYSVDDHGHAVRGDGHGKTRKFTVPVPNSMFISGPLFYSRYGDDILILYETSDSEYGVAQIVRIDAKSLKDKWAVKGIPFNITAGLIHDNEIYLTGVRYVSALDLVSGKYVWCLKGLFNNQDKLFDAFNNPTIDERTNTLHLYDKFSKNVDGKSYYININLKTMKLQTNAQLPNLTSVSTICN